MSCSNHEARAEEIIADVYGAISRVRDSGSAVTAIVLPVPVYRTIQEYRATLGETREGLPDYLGKYDLFGIPIYTDGGTDVIIKTGAHVPTGG
ncbi:MAG: hypothetical protein ACOCYB_03565 [Alkalispirochaeta sp.]